MFPSSPSATDDRDRRLKADPASQGGPVDPPDLNDDERAVLAHLREHRAEWVGAFVSALPRARRSITHRLLQAAIRERLVSPDALIWDEPAGWLRIALPDGGRLQARLAGRFAFDRFDLAGDLLDEVGRVLDQPVALLERLLPMTADLAEADRERYAHFRRELDNSTVNYALALTGFDMRWATWRPMAAERGLTTTLAWVDHQRCLNPDFGSLAFYEQLVVDGHPLHPGAKLRLGMSVADVLQYAPEMGAAPAVVPVAVAKHACQVASLDGETPAELLYREYPGLQAAVATQLADLGLDAADYEVVPLHPWQAKRTLPARYEQALARRELVPIRTFTLPMQALMSVRGLAPVGGEGPPRHHLKTAIDVQITGAVRTVSPQAAENGPMLSRLLRAVTAREQGFGGRLIVLEERAGIAYRPTDETLDEAARFVLAKNVAALVRENPDAHVGPGEVAMPGAAMLARSPFSDRPVVAELVDALAASRGGLDDTAAVEAFVGQYVTACLDGFLVLMTRYGISLEGHLQNCLPVFRDGALVRMLVRDFGGVRVLPERLAPHQLPVAFAAGSATVALDVADLRNKLFYPLIQNHLGELIATLVRHYTVSEARLWQLVAEACRSAYERLKDDPTIGLRAAEDEAVLFEPTLELKAMVTMRLKGDVTRYTFARVANPLAQAPVQALSAQEAIVQDYAARSAPALMPALGPAFVDARRSLLQRLVVAMVREGLLVAHPLPAERQIATELAWWEAPLGQDAALLLPVASVHAFGRLEIAGDVLYRQAETVRPVTGPVDLLTLVGPALSGVSEAAWRQLAAELDNGVGNLALAYAHARGAGQAAQARTLRSGARTVIDWVMSEAARDPDFNPTVFFEQLCVEGHRLHPGAKTKLGMTPAEVHQYAPEFGGEVDVRFVAVRRDRLNGATLVHGDDFTATLFEAFPQLIGPVTAACRAQGLSLVDYGVVPLHDWQLRHTLADLYAQELAEGVIVPLDWVALPCRATASFRTLVPASPQGGVALKLAVNSLMTSTLRSISSHSAANGTRFTRLIREVVRREPALAERIVPVCEVAGISFRVAATEQATPRGQAKSRNLTVVMRERIESLVGPDEVAIVACALYAESPLSGQPVLVELVGMVARTCGLDRAQAAERFFAEYVGILVPAVLRLMVRYGIGLEAHLQNCVPVFRAGLPVRVLVRDWGGVRIYAARLRDQGLAIDFQCGSVTLTEDLSELHNKVYYTLIQNHLAELVLLLSRYCGFPEDRAWGIVRQVCDGVFAELAASPTCLEAATADWAALTAPVVDFKALTRMRLDPDGAGYRYVPVPNPLWRAEAGEVSA